MKYGLMKLGIWIFMLSCLVLDLIMLVGCMFLCDGFMYCEMVFWILCLVLFYFFGLFSWYWFGRYGLK